MTFPNGAPAKYSEKQANTSRFNRAIDHIRILSIELELACNGPADAAKAFQMRIIFNIFPRISLHCKLVPVQYWEQEYWIYVVHSCGWLNFSPDIEESYS